MIKVLNIGVGLGGSRFACQLSEHTSVGKGTSNAILINISSDELAVLDKKAEKIVVGNVDGGAGKDRAFAIELFSKEFDFTSFVETIAKRVKKESVDIINVSFSVGGGTGSGIGPMLTSILLAGIERKLPSTIVMGFALMPAFNEGIGVFRNTILALNDVNKVIQSGGRFTIIENTGKEHGSSFVERREGINEIAAVLYSDYTNGKSGLSAMGVLDMNDKRSGLEFSGLHSFSRLKDCSIVKSPFIEPGSSNCKHMMAEIPEENADMYEQVLSTGVNLDFKYGYTTDEVGIVAYHGFNSIQRSIVAYRKRFDELKAIDMDGDFTTGDDAFASIRSEVFHYDIRKSSDTSHIDEDKPTEELVNVLKDAMAAFKDCE